jgi:hypothetical protein
MAAVPQVAAVSMAAASNPCFQKKVSLKFWGKETLI